jgi:NTE family protein
MNKLFSWALGDHDESKPRQPQKRINLALQGGGAHGAFTWGVLDELLADGRIRIDGVSGASSGAVNAVMLADGLLRGGPEEARKRLAEFWRAASIGGNLPELQRHVVERLFSMIPLEDSPMRTWLDAVGRFSPFEVNPLNINPLKQLIERFVDFDALRAQTTHPLFISATNVQTGALRIFTREEVTAEAVMASACLPLLFRAVEIDGANYWDGGYTGNPVLCPFLCATQTEDVLVVQIYPRQREEVPTGKREILSRISEITFNSSLMAELRAADFVNRLIEEGKLPRGTAPGEYRRLNLHRVTLEDIGGTLDTASRLQNHYEFFDRLHKLGRQAARQFLDAHFDDIGVRATIDRETGASAEPVK